MFNRNWAAAAAAVNAAAAASGNNGGAENSAEMLHRELARQHLSQQELAAYHQQAQAMGGLSYAIAGPATQHAGPPNRNNNMLYGSSAAESLMRRQVVLQQQQQQHQQQAAAAAAGLASLENRQQFERRLSQRQSSIASVPAVPPVPVPPVAIPTTTAEKSRNKRQTPIASVPKPVAKPTTPSKTKVSKKPPIQDIIEIDDSDDDDDNATPTKNKNNNSKSSSAVSSKTTTKTTKKRRNRASSNNNNPATNNYESSAAFKRLKTVMKDGHPVAVVHSWSREHLMEELTKDEIQRVQTILQLVLFHATGHTAATAPKNVPFPPAKIEMTITQIHEFAKEIVKEQAGGLRRAVDATFYKCAHSVVDYLPPQPQQTATSKKKTSALSPEVIDEEPLHPDAEAIVDAALLPGPSTADSSVPNPMQMQIPIALAPAAAARKSSAELAMANMMLKEKDITIRRQKQELDLLRKEFAGAVVEQKKKAESFLRERVFLKDQVARCQTIHTKSVRAYLRASVHSLRSLRKSMGTEDSDDDDEAVKDTGADMLVI
jgi:hypothetical protein